MQTIPLLGYADRFSVHPGQSIGFKISSTSPEAYAARLVRVISCDPNPDGPGIIEEDIAADFAGDYPSRLQAVHLGSYMTVPDTGALRGLESFTVVATIWPTTPDKDLQGVLSWRDPRSGAGFALAIDGEGARACLGSRRVAVGKPLVAKRWYRVWASFDAASGRFSVGQAPLSPRFDADDAGSATVDGASLTMPEDTPLLVAAFAGEPADRHFNGKIEQPMLLSAALEEAAIASAAAHPALFACWDFAQGISTQKATDTGPHGLHGRLINLPARAMMGAAWDGSAFAWPQRPEHYAAIHFHDDDIYDCGWETDFSFAVPADFRSGIYAVRLRNAAGDEEMLPFFVPAPKGRPQSRICVLIPTFTYTVYANIARGNTTDSLRRRIAEWGGWPWTADDHKEFGLSTYNLHSDGSGIAYSSRRRPIITMRTGAVSYPDVPGSGLRHFSADAHLWYWLETMGYDFDVITDDELHADGKAAIEGYDVVLTTTHPEYHTGETLDALQEYTLQGGHFMYMGGNGFYWKVALSQDWPDAIEIRRGEGGLRNWAAEPGEYYNAFDGTYGGMWRRNGRPPQQLCGVGFTSQGGHIGDAYRRSEASYAPENAWMFEGINDEIIGDFGLAGGGAAGFELDRADIRLGTPLNATVLASSFGHGEHFILVPEEVLSNILTLPGEPAEELIRSDIVYFETANGGAVFSVGSITFCGSLPVNECKNNISRLVANVLNRFLAG